MKTEHTDHSHQRWWNNLGGWIYGLRADRIVCNSTSTQRSFRFYERLSTAKKTTVIHNGVDCVQFRPDDIERDNAGTPEIVIGTVGRLVSLKDHRVMLRATRLLRDSGIECRVDIVGGGPEHDALIEYSVQLGIDDVVTFRGRVGRAEVRQALLGMDVFVVASRWEGFCNAVVEAMAASVPAVCSDIDTLREVVADAGVFFRVGDAEDLAVKIAALIQDPVRRRQLGVDGCRRAQTSLSIQASADAHRKMYSELMSR